MRIRQSTIKTWMQCPLQAKFAMEATERQPQNGKASFGTCIHKALEFYGEGGDVDGAIALFKDVWEHPEKLNCTPDYWPKFTNYGSLREKGILMLQEYHDKVRWESRLVVANEHRFLVPFGEHELEGTVDLLEVRKAGNGRRTLRIVDYKTNARAPTKIQLLWDIQMTTYIYASLQPEFWLGNGPDFPPMPNGETYFNSFFGMPRRAIWYQLMTNKEIDAGAREDEDFMRLYRVVTEIENAIDKQVFVPSISADACTFCNFHQQCAVAIKRPIEDDDEESWPDGSYS